METMEMFGLNEAQLKILYSFEYLITKEDIYGQDMSKKQETALLKNRWLKEWEQNLENTMSSPIPHKSKVRMIAALRSEYEKHENNTWYYLILLEAALFTPYIALGTEKEEIKKYKSLRFESQKNYIKGVIDEAGLTSSKCIDRFTATYKRSMDDLSGKWMKVALGVVGVVAFAGIAAATAGVAAGPIAVALFGSEFAGLSGAALTSACLAMAGGGAIAAGGAGMAGGVMAIVGGGALLGAAGGGAAVATMGTMIKSNPAFTVSQAAKLEVVLKEITLNVQQDIKMAQEVMDSLKKQIVELKDEILKLQNESKKNKDIISKMEKSLSYLEKAYKDMAVFKSSYEVGVNYVGKRDN